MVDQRDIISKEAIALSKKYSYLLLEYATAFGKTKIALDIANSTSDNGNKNLVVHFERGHKQNFINEIVKFDYNPNDFVFTTYASFRKQKDTKWRTIIFDEAHHFTQGMVETIKTLKANKVILLSPKMPYSKSVLWKSIIPSLYVDTKTIEEGVALGILPVPKIKTHFLELDNKKRDLLYTYKIGDKNTKVYNVVGIEEYMKIHNKFKVVINCKCTQREYYDILTYEYTKVSDKINELKETYDLTRDYAYRDKARILTVIKKRYGSERKTFLANCKLEYAKVLFEFLSGKKLLFTNSIENAGKINSDVIHSKQSAKVIKENISNFKAGNINSLVSINMMRESYTIPHIKHVIIQQLPLGSILDYIQMLGRTLREENAKLHLLVMSDTIDHAIHDKLKDMQLI